MSIPETQLSTWSNRGAKLAAQNTHNSVRTALKGAWRLQGKASETFLQGSYRNATNIRADSDVDLVTELQNVFVPNIEHLPEDQKALYRSHHNDVSYGWSEYRADVLASLSEYYGAGNVKPGNKAIKIAAASNRLASDVVVAIAYRLYKRYRGLNDQAYIEGIWFRDQSGHGIVNYPRQHFDNGAAKNATARTREQFKPVVRMFKNARGCLIDRRMIQPGLAPSYFIQGLLYNVPDEVYSASLQQTYCDVVNWLNKAVLDGFVCQNGVVPLFGHTPEQWAITSAQTFIAGLIDLWNNW